MKIILKTILETRIPLSPPKKNHLNTEECKETPRSLRMRQKLNREKTMADKRQGLEMDGIEEIDENEMEIPQTPTTPVG